MNVASKDLCAELYGLSGWTVTQGHVDISYNLGYLLRKLTFWTLESKHFGQFKASHKDINGKKYSHHANTPEDAACKLAIELFKQGILKKQA